MNWSRLTRPAFVLSVLIMAVSAIGMGAAISRYQIYLRKLPIYPEDGRTLNALPAETDHWKRLGPDRVEAAETLEVLGTDNYLTRTYEEKAPPDGTRPRHLQLHVAYYTGMIDTVPHVPDRCLVGGGMSIVAGPFVLPTPMKGETWAPSTDAEAGETLFTTRLSNTWSTAGGGRRVNLPRGVKPGSPLSLRINEFRGPVRSGEKEGPRFIAGYCFIANGGWVSSAEGVRFLAFNLTDDYAYYLKVQVGSDDVQSPEELAELSGSLLDDLIGELMTCVPDWARVKAGLWPPDNPKKAQTTGNSHP
jgi:hypothetical protein